MANQSDGSPSPLPDELLAALRRASDRTLAALQSLRESIRDHVHTEKSNGATLGEIDADLRGMITTAGGDASHPEYPSDRIDELTLQVLKWAESFYARKGGGR